MPVQVTLVLAAIGAIACTVLSVIFITPEKKREQLNAFFKFIHDLFNFKFLLLEKVLKVLYIFATLYCVIFGFFGLFSGYYNIWYGFRSIALQALLTLILGPIIIRLTYELLMMFVLLVKNTIEINKKIKVDCASKDEAPVEAAPINVAPHVDETQE